MSGLTRPARAEDLSRLWPYVRSAHLMPSQEALAEFSAAGAWRVRVDDAGDALFVSRWRAHLDVLAIRGLWAPDARVAGLVEDVLAVARSQGFARVLSPLLEEQRAGSYRDAGMRDFVRLVAFTLPQGALQRGGGGRHAPIRHTHRIRSARAEDVSDLEALDAACFDDFWRHGACELEEAIGESHVSVVDQDGAVSGYAVSILSGSTVTVARLSVAPACRRRGIAAALLAESDAWAGEQGACGLSLCTQQENAAARALYRSVGFAEARTDYRLLVTSC